MTNYQKIKSALSELSEGVIFSLEQPEEISYGDYSTNIAFPLGKKQEMYPAECAKDVTEILKEKLSSIVERIEVANPGFINFYLKDEVRTQEAFAYISEELKLDILNAKKVICEYTDPNPFKLFHIGHLVPNAIGESIARIYESVGATVTRVCYQGDVGMHVAATIWGIKNMGEQMPLETATLREKVAFLGKAYTFGMEALAESEEKKADIAIINKAIFERTDEDINKIYDLGKKWSIDYFETIYKKLGTKFDFYIFESEVAVVGRDLVLKNIDTVFEQSEGAVVYKGEKVGLHTRVFINSERLPTYEAKELGNCLKKEELVPGNDISIVVTGNEIDEYFKVIKAVLSEIDKNLSDKLKHVSHGMLRLPEGKMSSRTGEVIQAEDLIEEVKERLKDKFDSGRIQGEKREQLINDVAVSAIKYSILKIAPGKDIVFDFEKSISFDGDSGPYLQYTHARLTQLILKCCDAKSITTNAEKEIEIERLINSFANTLNKSYEENAPQHIVIHLTQLTRAFNAFYGRVRIISEANEVNKYHIDLCRTTKNIINKGLYILGIVAPDEM